MVNPKPVEVGWLVKTRRVSPLSPIVLLCKELGVRWLPYLDGYIYGPAPGIAELLDAILMVLKPRSMLDLFCGSGALSKLAHKRGVRRIKAVDIYAEVAKRNLKRLRGVEVVEADATAFRDRPYDLLVADPPESLADELLEMLPRLSRLCRKVALIWFGPYHRATERVLRLKGRRRYVVAECWGDAVAIIWKPGISRDKIREALTIVEAV